MRLIAVGLVIVGALAALGFARHEERIREQDRLAIIASDLAGRKVGVRCPSFFSSLLDTRGEAGRVQFDASGRPSDHTDLSPQTCKALRRLDRIDFSCLERGDCGYDEFNAAGLRTRSRTRRFTFAVIATKARPSATRCRTPDSWRKGSACRVSKLSACRRGCT